MSDGDVVTLAEELVGGGDVGRLGRHVEHDPASRSFKLAERLDAGGHTALRTQQWNRAVPIYRQGHLGSCTANATAGVLSTADADDVTGGKVQRITDQNQIVQAYSMATTLDSFGGQYPPDDTGSSGLAACKAWQQMGLCSRYEWGFGLADVLLALSWIGPVAIGVQWYEGFDNPGVHTFPDGAHTPGWVSIAGQPRGGHEFELLRISPSRQYVVAANSWGPGWADHGYFRFSFADLERLLGEQGDACIPFA